MMSDTPTCKRIIILTVLVFLGQIFYTRPAVESDYPEIFQSEEFRALAPQEREFQKEEILRQAPGVSPVQSWLQLDSEKVMQGQVWRLLTTALLHDPTNVMHILFNMLFLYWFGVSLEAHYGSREFLWFYVVAAIVASCAFVGIQLLTGERNPAIGASGAVMAVTCVFAMWNPGFVLHIYFLFPVPIKWVLVFYVVADLYPVLASLAGMQTYTGVAHAAHLGGLAFGFLYWRNSWSFGPLADFFAGFLPSGGGGQRRPTNRPNPTSARRESSPHDRQLENDVDHILAKISIHGEGSLTEAERETLIRASSKYRDRES